MCVCVCVNITKHTYTHANLLFTFTSGNFKFDSGDEIIFTVVPARRTLEITLSSKNAGLCSSDSLKRKKEEKEKRKGKKKEESRKVCTI